MKSLWIAFGVGVVLVTSFVAFLWFTVRTSSTDVSNQEPYKSLIGRDLSLTRDIELGMNREPDSYQRRLFATTDFAFTEEVPKVADLPALTSFRFTHAKTFHNGVSGYTWQVLFGTITDPKDGKTYDFEYNWGAVGGQSTPTFW